MYSMNKALEISIIPMLFYIVLCIEVIKIENCLNQCYLKTDQS
jgi:hypothetical protein